MLRRRSLNAGLPPCAKAALHHGGQKVSRSSEQFGIRDYSVLEGRTRIGRIRFADERIPPVWLDTAKAEFKAAWALKARTPPEQLAAAYKAMNIRDDG